MAMNAPSGGPLPRKRFSPDRCCRDLGPRHQPRDRRVRAVRDRPADLRGARRGALRHVPGSQRAYIGPTPQVVAILRGAEGFQSRSELQDAAGLKDREHFRGAYLEPLLAAGWIEMGIPDKPRSSKQRYRTTAAGKRILEE